MGNILIRDNNPTYEGKALRHRVNKRWIVLVLQSLATTDLELEELESWIARLWNIKMLKLINNRIPLGGLLKCIEVNN